jgi:rubrerythrin
MLSRKKACGIAAVVIALVSLNVAVAEESLQPQTLQDLKSAMENEAFTSWKYTLFAEHARKEGKFALAEILETTAGMEHSHFMEWARRSGLVGEDWNNVANAIVGEYTDDMAMYARLADRAEAAGDKGMAQRFREVRAAEEMHRDMFTKAVSTSYKPDKP